jgi:hypothetical protein
MKPNIPPEQLAEWLRTLPKEKILEGNTEERKQAEEDWKLFVSLFKKAICSICKKPLKSFSESTPCLHWLLRPKKFKKKHFPLLYERFTYFRISAFVRWVASIESPVKNINDIKEEHPGDKLIDFTAKYRHITWSFSCGKSDFEGHTNSKEGNYPHYHFRMNLDNNAFIRYGDFHVPFHDDDLYDFELFRKHGDLFKHSYGHGTGMAMFLDTEEGAELVIENSTPTDNYHDAAFEMQTLVMAPLGETISGKLIAEVQAEAKSSGKTIASIIRDKAPNANIITVLSPGPGVPAAKQRSERKRKKADNTAIETDAD